LHIRNDHEVRDDTANPRQLSNAQSHRIAAIIYAIYLPTALLLHLGRNGTAGLAWVALKVAEAIF
jgi:hypothetical protein